MEQAIPGENGADASERAYQLILEMVLTGRVGNETWLREQGLAQSIGVSRTPVREALKRLAAEGIVNLVPHRGAQVISLSEHDVDALYDLRARFEPLAVELAVPRLTDERIAELEKLDNRMQILVAHSKVDAHEMTGLNNAFHEIFLSEAGNRHLALAMQAITRPALVTRTFHRYSERGLRRSMQHHTELVEAARVRDGEWASAVMRAHILAARHSAAD